MIYVIPEFKIESIKTKLDGLNLRIGSFPNSTLLSYTISKPYRKLLMTPTGLGYEVSVVNLDLINPMVSMNDWSFLAILEHYKDGNLILKTVFNDVEIPDHFRHSGSHCDHCNTKRYRKNTYLIHNSRTGEIFQIGSSCINLYLGFDATVLVSHASLMTLLNDGLTEKDYTKISKGVFTRPLVDFLKKSYFLIKTEGYISSKMHYFDATKYPHTTGQDALYISVKKDVYDKYCIENGDLDIDAEINKITEWVSTLDDNNDYIKNIKLIIKSNYVTQRSCNTAASVIAYYFKTIERMERVEIENLSVYIGNIKDKIEIEMTFDSVKGFNGPYGYCNRYSFYTDEGNNVIWFSRGKDFVIGKKYKGTVTIAKHSQFNDIKQTIVNRCKLEEII